MKDIERKLGINEPFEWTKVPTNHFLKMGGGPLVAVYGSFYNTLKELYPNTIFSPLRFSRIPTCFLKGTENHKIVLDELKERLWIREHYQWFLITHSHFKRHGILSILHQYSSLRHLLETIYPDVPWCELEKEKARLASWNPWKCGSTPKRLPPGYWNHVDNQREFLDHVANVMNIKDTEDWSRVTTDKIRELGGRQLLRKYDTFFDVLMSVYPEQKFHVGRSRQRVPNKYWESRENQRRFFDELIETLGLASAHDLSQVSVSDIIKNGGSRIIRHHRCYFDLLCALYPEIEWKETDLKTVPWGYWTNDDNILNFIELVKQKYRITKPEDWYRISDIQFREAGGSGLLRKYGTKAAILKRVFPDYEWDEKLLSKRDKRASQRWMFCQAQQIFPGEEIIEDFILHGVERDSHMSVELDVYVPERRLALEYQGEHHYYDIPSFGHIELYTIRDEEKLKLCKQNDIHLVIVPYWWDGELESLKKMIEESRKHKE